MKNLFKVAKCLFCSLLVCSFTAHAQVSSDALFKSAGAMLTNADLNTKQMDSIINTIGNDVYARPIDFIAFQKVGANKNLDPDQLIYFNRDKISIPLLSTHIKDPNHSIKLVEEYYFGNNNGNYSKAYADLIDDISALGEVGGIILLNRDGFHFAKNDEDGGSSTYAALAYAICKKLIHGSEKEKQIIKYNFGQDISCYDHLNKDNYGNDTASKDGTEIHNYQKFECYFSDSKDLNKCRINAKLLNEVPGYMDVSGFYNSIGWLVQMFGVSSSDLYKRTVAYGWNIDGNVRTLNEQYVYVKHPYHNDFKMYIPDIVYSTIQSGSIPYSFEKDINALKIQPGYRVSVMLLNVDPVYYGQLMNSQSRLDNDHVVGIAYSNLWPEKEGDYSKYTAPWAAYDSLWGLNE